MYVVYAENDFTLLGKEYFGTDGKSIIGFHDPNRASHFESVETADAVSYYSYRFESCPDN